MHGRRNKNDARIENENDDMITEANKDKTGFSSRTSEYWKASPIETTVAMISHSGFTRRQHISDGLSHFSRLFTGARQVGQSLQETRCQIYLFRIAELYICLDNKFLKKQLINYYQHKHILINLKI